MMTLNRRKLMIGSAGLAGLALGVPQAFAVDAAELHKEPELGDMWLGAEAQATKVTLVEYASATCPHCAAFHQETYKQLKTEFIDTKKIRFVFREFPLNDAALAAFMIARAANKEAYFPLIDVYFETLQTWAQGNVGENLFNIAKQAGFTREKFDATLKDEALAKKIIAIKDDGEKFGVGGTPTFFLNGEIYEGDRTFDAMKKTIDPLLA
jgi:protein-disulfide isomerase